MTAAASVKAEAAFVKAISALAPIFTAKPGGEEFIRPGKWQEISLDGNQVRIRAYKPGDAICAVMGGPVAAVDVDPRNGGDVDAVRQLLDGLGVTVFAEVATPGRGAHFYIAGHPELASVHTTPGLISYPGVDIQSHGTNVFLPGTRRPKYNGKGYTVVYDNLEALGDGGDPVGAETFAGWVADHRASRPETFEPSETWNGTPPDARQAAYLQAMLRNTHERIAAMKPDSGRNTAIYNAGMCCGNFIAGAGLNETEAITTLMGAANHCGLIADDGERAVLASIRSGISNGRKRPRAVPPGESGHSGRADAAGEAFWLARPVLTHIRGYAQARRVGPWAVLGDVLVRAVAAVPPRAVLPPLTGGYASLNLFVAIVGDPGDGKGGAERVAEEAVDFGHLKVAGVGSGEGIAHLFMRREKRGEDPVQHSTSVVMSVAEIDTLTALTTGRRGTTLLPEIRKAWMGEALGFSYADPDKRLPVKGHTYRLCVVAGVQPGRAGALLDDADGGAPQRFLWLPASDSGAPDNQPDLPDTRWPWDQPVRPSSGFLVLDVPDIARAAVDTHRLARLRQTSDDGLDGHTLLCWEKVAAALALLDSRTKITDEDWQLAETVMAVSTRTREQVVEHLRHTKAQANTARGHAEADRALIVDERVEDTTIKRVCAGIVRTLRRADGDRWLTRSQLRQSFASRDRGWFDPALARLIDAGQIETAHGDRPDQLPGGPGDRYRLTEEPAR